MSLLSSAHYLAEYPASIPVYSVRLDVTTNKPVERGVIQKLFTSQNQRYTLDEFYKLLQCPAKEPDLDFMSGGISLLKLLPPTRDTVEIMSAYSENRDFPWEKAIDKMNTRFKKGIYGSELMGNGQNGFLAWRMFRIINQTLYYDWPWGIERLESEFKNPLAEFNGLYPVLKYIKDLPDSVFFLCGEVSSFPFDFPFPMFGNAPSVGSNTIPWPWPRNMKEGADLYRKIIENHNSTFTQAVIDRIHDAKPWEERIPKATFFAAWDNNRQIMFDQSRLHPDLFESEHHGRVICQPWNPLSGEKWQGWDGPRMACHHGTDGPPDDKSRPPGSCKNMEYVCNRQRDNHDKLLPPDHYKYVIVPLGSGGHSTSSRVVHLLAYSGCVVLMPISSIVYHFSSRLIPWVHYVPLAFNMADAYEKVSWLRENDELAKQIAANARAFGQSHLRLEDFYCYNVRAMHTIGDIMRHTDAASSPFTPKPMQCPVDSHGFADIDIPTFGRKLTE